MVKPQAADANLNPADRRQLDRSVAGRSRSGALLSLER